MRAIANTRVSILSGTETDDVWGDTVDATTVVASRIPASILERSRVITTPEAPTPRTIRYYLARLPAGTQVESDDRIRDEITGAIYAITSSSSPASVGHTADVRLDLKRVT